MHGLERILRVMPQPWPVGLKSPHGHLASSKGQVAARNAGHLLEVDEKYGLSC